MNDPSLRDLEHDASEAVRLRARLVQDTLSLGPTRAAEKHGVTRQTAAKWTNLYRTSGTRRLSDPTRQRRTIEEMRHAILSAPLWMPTAKWSSRSIAEALGISQSYVARAWDSMRSSTQLADDLAAETQGCQPELLGLLVTSDYAVVAFRLKRRGRRDGSAVPAHVNAGMQRSLRTVLASDLIRHQILSVSPADATSFWEKVTDAVDADATVLAVASEKAPIPPEVAHRKICRNASEWQSLFSVFVRWGASLSPQSLQDVEGELRQWARRPRREFTWVVPTTAVRATDSGPAARLALRRLGPERALADEIVVTIRQGITNGRLAPGDRVTERYLAGRLRTTRGQVRSAMRLLERDGLLTITTGHAAVVPVLTTSDVVETYAARRALGALVIRASVRWPPEARQSVIRSLDALERWAAAGDVYRTGEADIEFQNTLAEASGLVRIAPMLQILAEHLRMFIAVMGLDYAYPIDAILRDDWGIFEAIDSGDGETAAELWRIKMNDATTYMLEQLSSAKKRSAGMV
jgi:DNA-binding GntR family transcriptional regulator